MKTVILFAALFAILAVAAVWAVWAWTTADDAQMSIHGYVALVLMIVFSLITGCGLMAMMFYSSRKGYDEPPKAER